VHAENWHFPSVLGLSDEGKLLGMRTSFAFPAKNMFLQYAPICFNFSGCAIHHA
jgi:hypothetical protein